MNRCPYCGREYPDEVAVCPLDGEALGRPAATRKKVTGVWRGCYGYGPRGDRPGFVPTLFTLKLKQGWTAHFTGSVTEDAPAGMPGNGKVDGYFNYPGIELTKQMPVGYALMEDGSRKTLREMLVEQGVVQQQELPGLPILYQGRFLDANRVQGTWIIQPRPLRLPGGKTINMPGGVGYWCAEFITEKLETSPGGGPTTELFDKSRLTDRELADVEPPPLCCLGEFPAAEAEQWASRLAAEEIYVSFAAKDAEPAEGAQADEFVRVYVRAEDEPAARDIMGNKVNGLDEEHSGNET